MHEKHWEFEGEWYIQPDEGLLVCVNTEFAAKTLLNLLNEFEKSEKRDGIKRACRYFFRRILLEFKLGFFGVTAEKYRCIHCNKIVWVWQKQYLGLYKVHGKCDLNKGRVG